MHRDIRLRVGALIAIVVAAVAGLTAQVATDRASLQRTLVLPFTVIVDGDVPGGDGASFWLGEAAALLLAEDLELRGVSVLSRTERVAAFSTLQLPGLTALTRATMIRVGELVGATELIVGEIRLGEEVTATARAVRLDAARDRIEAEASGPSTGVYAVIEQLAGDLVPGTVRAVADDRLPLAAFEPYVKGLVSSTPAVQERFLEAARRQAPSDGRVLLALSEFHAGQGDYDRALAAARAVPGESRFDRQARFAAALALIELVRYDEAFATLQTLHDEAPASALANALGVIQMRRGSTPQTGQPTQFFQRAVEDSPNQPDYLFNLGYAFARSRNGDEALLRLREVVRLDPADGDAHLVMSHILMAAGREAEAQRELDLARQLGTRLEPETLSLTDRVPPGLERLTGRIDGPAGIRVAAAIAGPELREQAELAAFHLARGRRLFEAGDDRGAVQELRRAVYLEPYNDASHVLLGQVYRRSGRLADAVAAFRIAAWARESLVARLQLAETLYALGEREAALAEAHKAVALAPSSAEARAVLARIEGGDAGHSAVESEDR